MVWIYSLVIAAGATGRLETALPAALLAVFFARFCRCGRGRSAQVLLLAALCFGHGFISRADFEYGYGRVLALKSDRAGSVRTFSGRVTGFPEQRPGGVRFRMEADAGESPLRLLVTAVDFRVGYGDSVTVTGTLSGGRRERYEYLFSRDAHGYLRAGRGEPVVWTQYHGPPGPRVLAWRLHEACRVRLSRHLGSRCGIPAALVLGERGWIGRGLRSRFTALGINHLLALSGMHLGLIAGLILAIGRFFGRANRVALLLVLSAYVLVVGEAVSLYRAYTMALILIVAFRCERPVRPLDVLGTALLVVLLYRPGFVCSVAFQLSFTATAAVLFCVTSAKLRRRPGWKSAFVTGVAGSLVVSLCVQVFLLPLQLRYFDGVSLLTPPATLLFLPAVATVMLSTAAALAADLLSAGHFTGLYGIAGWITGLFERALIGLADRSPPLVSPPSPNLLLFYAGQAIWWIRPSASRWPPRGGGNKRVVAAVTGTVVCLVSFVPFW
jgi:ComEC/Rec2-related protein